MSQHVNIVSFNVPYPANYGGAIDVFYKIKCLHAAGVKVHLHCFAYGRDGAPELEALCEQTFYYERKTGMGSNLSLLPYTVKSRQDPQLKENLLKNDFPILFEVLHTCFLMKDPHLKARKKIFRHSNIEHSYYYEIAKAERDLKRKIFHYIEGWRLKRFEKVLRFADRILAVNEKDTLYFKEKYKDVRSVYLPSFHANESISALTGKGDYVLIHGNLGVSENYEAVMWLLKNVVTHLPVRTIIAGLNPPDFLVKEVGALKHAELIANPSEPEMEKLIQNAHVHLLYTGQPTGLKLKLLNVLFRGRFVVCNENMLSGTGLTRNRSLRIAQAETEFRTILTDLMSKSFDEEMLNERRRCVEKFDNGRNVRKLIDEIF
jgi:glycosyltransferase involved in cell wall biosynthesis